MRRLAAFVAVGALVIGMGAPTSFATELRTTAFKNCAALQKSFPNGIARDAKARAKAVRDGFIAPRVSRGTYLKNAKRLDRDADGVMCARKASTPGGATPSDPVVPPNPEYAGIAQAVQALGASCMVVRKGGDIVGEWYWSGRSASTGSEGFSTMKAVSGTLIGIAQSQGKLNVNQRASDFISEWRGTPSESVTIRDLLSMTSGRASRPDDALMMTISGNATAYAIGLGQATPPVTVWLNSDSAVQTLARVLSVATGESVVSFAKRNLFDPLGMTATSLVPDGGTGANMAFNYQTSCRDLSRLAQLYVQGGTWNGTQIIAADYVNQARSPSSSLNRGYGYLFNLNTPGAENHFPGAPADAFSFIGQCGQVSSGFPAANVVVSVMTTAGLLDALSCDPTGGKVSGISQAIAGAAR